MGSEAPYKDEEKVRKLYIEKEKPLVEVAEELDCHRNTLTRWMDKFGIDRRAAQPKAPADIRDEDALVEMYHQEELSTPEIAERYDCTPTTVAKYMSEFDIEVDERRYSRGAEANRVDRASFRTNDKGYEVWGAWDGEKNRMVAVHRLLGVAEYGVDEVADMEVHHVNGVRWDNRASNIALMGKSDHRQLHAFRENKNGAES